MPKCNSASTSGSTSTSTSTSTNGTPTLSSLPSMAPVPLMSISENDFVFTTATYIFTIITGLFLLGLTMVMALILRAIHHQWYVTLTRNPTTIDDGQLILQVDTILNIINNEQKTLADINLIIIVNVIVNNAFQHLKRQH